MELTKKQKQAIELLTDDVTDYVGYGGAAGGGKTVLGCYWLMQLGFYVPGAKFFIGRDNIKDTRASVLKTWGEVAKAYNFTAYKFNDIGIIFDNGSEVELLDLTYYPYKDPEFDRLGSKEYTAGWIEECQQTHYLAFEVVKTRIGRWMNENVKSKILCTFNPKKNWVDTTFYRPFSKQKELAGHRFIYALPGDNQFLPKDYVKRLYELKDEATKQRLLFGNFDYDDDPNALISYEQIRAIYNNEIKRTGKQFISADIARYGSDKAVIMRWDGLVVKEVLEFATSSMTDLYKSISAMRIKHGIPTSNIVVDEDGVGGGVVDMLRCSGFINNSSAVNSVYSNLKSECGYKLAEMIDLICFEAEITEQQKEFINTELGQLKTYDIDKDGKMKIMPKDKIKENIGRSPDYLDCFLMRMFFELKIPKRAISKAIMT